MELTQAKARKASLQIAVSHLSQAADDREGPHFQRLRQSGTSVDSLVRLRLEMLQLSGDLRAEARRHATDAGA